MRTAQARNRRLTWSSLAALLCWPLLLGDDLPPLPYLAVLAMSTSSEEEAPSEKGDSSDTETPVSPAGARHCAVRRGDRDHSFRPQTASSPLPAPLTGSLFLRLPPPPRERDGLNGVGAVLRC
jgi:hypothetical protein